MKSAEKYDFDRDNIIAIGYSNGANIAASLLFHYQNALKGAILHHPMVPRRGIDLPDLSGKSVFIAAGTNDPICSPMESMELQSLLEKANANVELHWENRGHQLTLKKLKLLGNGIRLYNINYTLENWVVMMNSVYQPIVIDTVLDLIWNNTTDAIFALDHHGSVIDANPTFGTIIGWEMEELNSIAFPPFIVNMKKEEHQTLLSQLKSGQNFPYEIVKRRHKDGALLDILASYWSVNNERILAIGMYKDFTEQMLIQRKLEESEYCYRTLVEYLPEAIVKQRNDKIEFASSSAVKLFGRKKLDEIIDYSISGFSI